MLDRLIGLAIDYIFLKITPSEEELLEKRIQRLRKLREELKDELRETQKAIEEASKIEDVEAAIEHLKQAAKKVTCPVCKGVLLNTIEYFLEYDYKAKLAEEGVPMSKLNEEYEKRYKAKVEEMIQRLKRELLVSDYDFRLAREKFKEIAIKV